MNATARRPRIDTDRRTDEVRCAHRDCYGNVCDACFAVTPWLMHSYGRTYRMSGAEYTTDAASIASGVLVVSAATPTVTVVAPTDIVVGDRIVGYTANPARPLVVSSIAAAAAGWVRFVAPDAKTRVIRDALISVVR